MSQHRHHIRTHKNRKNFIILPIIFCLLGYLIITAVMYPILKPYKNALNMVLWDRPTADIGEYTNLFDPAKPQNVGETEILASTIEFPSFGEAFGKITVDGTNVDATLFFGDDSPQLDAGVGMYNGSGYPGVPEKTCLIAGHNNTFLNGLKDAKIGAQIHLDTNYGQYVYEITDMQPQEATSFDLYTQTADVVLYTCYPFDMLGLTPTRYFVYGKRISGPIINVHG